jgi:sugar lactone lactonase YvrE
MANRVSTGRVQGTLVAVTSVLLLLGLVGVVPEAQAASPSGTLTIAAGKIGEHGAPKAGKATAVQLGYPESVAVDSQGNRYTVADDAVEKITTSGTLSIVAGEVGKSGRPTAGKATKSRLGEPETVAVDAKFNLYIADADGVVEKVTSSGTLSIVAGEFDKFGTPTPGKATKSTLGGEENGGPTAAAVDAKGDIFIADHDNGLVEKVSPSGTLSIAAGERGSSGPPKAGAATKTTIGYPVGVAVDAKGDLYIAELNYAVVEKVTPAGKLTIVAGEPGKFGNAKAGKATKTMLASPSGVAVDAAGDLYISDGLDNTRVVGLAGYSVRPDSSASGDVGNVVEKVTPAGVLSIVAGELGNSGKVVPGPALRTQLGYADGVALDKKGNLFIADSNNGVIEKVT